MMINKMKSTTIKAKEELWPPEYSRPILYTPFPHGHQCIICVNVKGDRENVTESIVPTQYDADNSLLKEVFNEELDRIHAS